MQENYSQKISGAGERIQQLQTKQAELERQVAQYTSMAGKLAAVDNDTALSALLVNQLIERVTVNGPNDVTIKFAFESGYERGLSIPETRQPGVIHHARLGSMESNVFALIGNRMKGRRCCCWSVNGANHLASLLCLKHTTGLGSLFSGLEPSPAQQEACVAGKPISVSKMPVTSGRGPECYKRASIPNIPWLKNIVSYRSFTDLNS